MAVYFVKQNAIAATPSDSNDGLDPLGIGLTAATFTNATMTLAQASAFASYTFTAGDLIYISGGTGVTAGLYEIASKIDNDSITLVEDIGGTNPTDVTSSDGPFATPAHALNSGGTGQSLSPGDEVRICTDATYALATTITPNGNGTPPSKVKCFGANDRGVIDGSKATLLVNAFVNKEVFTCNNISFWHFRDLVANGDNKSSFLNATASVMENIDCNNSSRPGQMESFSQGCTYINCTADSVLAFNTSTSNEGNTYVGCLAKDCTVRGFQTGHSGISGRKGDLFYGCRAQNCVIGFDTRGHDQSHAASLINCIADNNSGDGIRVHDGNILIAHCTIVDNGDGVDMSQSDQNDTNLTIVDSLITHNSGYGIRVPSSWTGQLLVERSNGFYANTSGDISSGSIDASSTTGADPLYTAVQQPDDDDDDFTLQSGSPYRGVANAWVDGTHTTYPDRGAIQHQDSEGGGGGSGGLLMPNKRGNKQ